MILFIFIISLFLFLNIIIIFSFFKKILEKNYFLIFIYIYIKNFNKEKNIFFKKIFNYIKIKKYKKQFLIENLWFKVTKFIYIPITNSFHTNNDIIFIIYILWQNYTSEISCQILFILYDYKTFVNFLNLNLCFQNKIYDLDLKFMDEVNVKKKFEFFSKYLFLLFFIIQKLILISLFII